ncbi:dicarboxylate/amino acid:cation symporter [Billgrantia tianxiuensis]|jgi:Na+/H+-dicarboxylate symporter|uniref:Dicarboxylate/amino acid:cation symporter n=1 Tax=Billgrantia tianxiuensis TaxID=2497861 RepID=A0A6I6SQ73_9GAMM|nr:MULTISPECIES: dicarboxylate/amino acid:cation symporter [Halomonas]MCE8035763.1 dicarboxylate/amino acid:cation symporter [Halomonas sp. MCCC 1A11057]QHC50664.1 dicarboxylate/amino acid:cation symporter [Halomonas tianxiuensis]
MADTQTLPRRGFLSPWTRLPLWKQIFIALVLGLSLGVVLNQVGRADLAADIKPLGDLFIRGIKMLIVPLVFVSLVTGVASLNNLSKMGRLSFKTLLLYLGMTAVAIAIGLVLASVFQPGVGIELGTVAAVAVPEAPTAVETLLGLVPTNAVEAFAEGNVLQIIVFAILFGLCITLVGEKARPVREFFESAAEIIYRMTSIIIAFTPYGVFALMTWVAGTYGLEMLLPLAKVIGIVYLGCIVHAVVVYGGMLRFLARLNPLRYFQGSIEPIMLAFTSTSSAGTLPVTMMAAEQNLGVKRGVSSFVLPLGATINMDGTALYQGVCALFIAQAYGVDLGAGAYATIILTATLGSIGTAGVPGAGLIMLSLVLTSVGLPLEGVAIIAGIDRVLDMARTGLNVAGDCAVSCLVAKSEGELDEAVYNTPHVMRSSFT